VYLLHYNTAGLNIANPNSNGHYYFQRKLDSPML